MANNRLYIVDEETGDKFLLAKSSGDGWRVWRATMLVERLDQWLDLRDMDSSFGNKPAAPSKLKLITENEEGYLPAEDLSVTRNASSAVGE